MAEIMAALAAVGTFAAANAGTIATVGSVVSAAGSVVQGVRANQASKATAKALKYKGEQEVALAQRRAYESRKEKDRALGRLKAVAAGSGAGTDGTVVDLAAGIEQKGEYNALMDMYNGLSARNDLRNEASMARYEGKSALMGGIVEGASTIYGDYGRRSRATAAYKTEYQGS
jgi:hypothetical protein